MTTEVLRNMIYAGRPLDDLRFVVLDEVHYLQDAYRGPVWEEVIIHVAAARAAGVPVGHGLERRRAGRWLTEVRGPTATVIEHRRPVELRAPLPGRRRRRGPAAGHVPTLVDGRPNPEGGRLRRRAGPGPAAAAGPAPAPVVHPRPGRGGRAPGRASRLLPAIYFIFSRAGLRRRRPHLPRGRPAPDHRRGAGTGSTEIVESTGRGPRPTRPRRCSGTTAGGDGLEAGIAAHHAGMVPAVQGGGRGLLRGGPGEGGVRHRDPRPGHQHAGPVAWSSSSLSKFTGERHETLTPPQYTQLTGRAGPAGHRRARARHRALVAVRALRRGGRAGRQPPLRAPLGLPPHLQHGRQPGPPPRPRDGPPPALPVLRPVPGRPGRGPGRAAARRAPGAAEVEEEAARCDRGDVEEYLALVERRTGSRSQTRRARRRRAASSAGCARVRCSVRGRPRAGGGAVRGPPGPGRRAGAGRQPARARSLDLGAPGDFDRPPDVAGRGRAAPAVLAQQPEVPRRGGPPPAQRAPGGPAGHARGAADEADEHPVAGCPDVRGTSGLHGGLGACGARSRPSSERRPASRLARPAVRPGAQAPRGRGCLDGWSLTPEGERLARVYHESDLLVAECLERGLLDGLDPPGLAGLVSLLHLRAPQPGGTAAAPCVPRRPRCGIASKRWPERAPSCCSPSRRPACPAPARPTPAFLPLAYEWAAGEGSTGPRGRGAVAGRLRPQHQAAPRPAPPDRRGRPRPRRPGGPARPAAKRLDRGVVAASSGVPSA